MLNKHLLGENARIATHRVRWSRVYGDLSLKRCVIPPGHRVSAVGGLALLPQQKTNGNLCTPAA